MSFCCASSIVDGMEYSQSSRMSHRCRMPHVVRHTLGDRRRRVREQQSEPRLPVADSVEQFHTRYFERVIAIAHTRLGAPTMIPVVYTISLAAKTAAYESAMLSSSESRFSAYVGPMRSVCPTSTGQADGRGPVERRAMSVERRPIDDGVAGTAGPCCVPAAVTEAGLMTHQHLTGTEVRARVGSALVPAPSMPL